MIYVCLGKREVGKTTLAAYLVNKLPARVIFDPRGLYPSGHRVTRSHGITVAFDALTEMGKGEIVITPDGSVPHAFDTLARELKVWVEEQRPPIGVMVDEVRFVGDPSDVSAFDWVLRCATRHAVTVVFTAHRPVDIFPNVRSIVDGWCIFHTTQENDLKVLSGYLDAKALARVARLGPHEFVFWDDTKGVARVVVDSASWYRPLTTANRRVAIDPLPTGTAMELPSSGLFDRDPSEK